MNKLGVERLSLSQLSFPSSLTLVTNTRMIERRVSAHSSSFLRARTKGDTIHSFGRLSHGGTDNAIMPVQTSEQGRPTASPLVRCAILSPHSGACAPPRYRYVTLICTTCSPHVSPTGRTNSCRFSPLTRPRMRSSAGFPCAHCTGPHSASTLVGRHMRIPSSTGFPHAARRVPHATSRRIAATAARALNGR